jgi:hypothetical protein
MILESYDNILLTGQTTFSNVSTYRHLFLYIDISISGTADSNISIFRHLLISLSTIGSVIHGTVASFSLFRVPRVFSRVAAHNFLLFNYFFIKCQ